MIQDQEVKKEAGSMSQPLFYEFKGITVK